MRPSVHLPIQVVTTRDVRYFLTVLTSGGHVRWPFELKIATLLTAAVRNVYTNFGFLSFFFNFRVRGRAMPRVNWNCARHTAGISRETCATVQSVCRWVVIVNKCGVHFYRSAAVSCDTAERRSGACIDCRVLEQCPAQRASERYALILIGPRPTLQCLAMRPTSPTHVDCSPASLDNNDLSNSQSAAYRSPQPPPPPQQQLSMRLREPMPVPWM